MTLYKLLACICFTTLVSPAWAKECATTYSDLDKTEKLQSLKKHLPQTGSQGFVNETKGSYFFITSTDKDMTMIFFTTGMFDLYGIRRDGPLEFCDDGDKLTVIGLGRTQTLYLSDTGLQFGERTPRQSFSRGEMPEALQKIHKFDVRSLASK